MTSWAIRNERAALVGSSANRTSDRLGEGAIGLSRAARSPVAVGRLRREGAAAGGGEMVSGPARSAGARSGDGSGCGAATLKETWIGFDSQVSGVRGRTPSEKSATRCAVSEASRTAIHRPDRSRAAWDTKHLSTEARRSSVYPRGQASIRIRQRPYHRPGSGQTGCDQGRGFAALPSARQLASLP